jgi:hypothetical protein
LKSQLDGSYSEKVLPFYDATQGQVMEVKGVGRRRTHLSVDLRNRTEEQKICK